MDNDSFLDVIDETDLRNVFGIQNDTQGSLFNWADEFLGDESEAASSSVAIDTGNLATNANHSNLLLTSQNYAVSSSVPAQSIIAPVTSQYPASNVTKPGMMIVGGQSPVNNPHTGLSTQILKSSNQPLILKTASGQQIQLNRQAQLQFLQQQQQQVTANTTFNQLVDQQTAGMAQQTTAVIGRSVTPGGSTINMPFGSAQVTQTIPQLKSASPAPNVNLVHLPPVQQQQHQQQQQFQIASGTILQLPSATGGASQGLGNTTLFQGQTAILGNTQQQANLVNTNSTVIQNPNIVNVNVAQPQQRNNLGINIQGTLIQTAEGKSILIPSQNIAQPINIQGLSVATPIQQPAIQQSSQTTLAGMLLAQQQQQQQQALSVDTRTNQGLQQIVVNHQGQQILVQRAGIANQSQNVVRTASGQLGIVQVQQRTSQPAQQLHNTQLQNITSGMGTQQLKLIQQGTSGQTAGVQIVNQGTVGQASGLQMVNQGTSAQTAGLQMVNQGTSGQTAGVQMVNQGTSAQTAGLQMVNQGTSGQTAGVQMVNIGGQSVSLQQLTNQLGNIQGLQLNQQQQQQLMFQQPQGQSTSTSQITFPQSVTLQQGQGQGMTLQQGHLDTTGSTLLQQQPQPQQVLGTGSPASSLQVNTSASSVENQTRLILQQIQNSLRKSQANASVSASPAMAPITAKQTMPTNTMKIKQEPETDVMGMAQSNKAFKQTFLPSTSVKTEPNLIESLIKQEADVKPRLGSCSAQPSSSIHALLTNTGSVTQATTTVSQASTQMSLFVLSNSSQNVLSNSSSSISSASGVNTLPMTSSFNSANKVISSTDHQGTQHQQEQPAGGTTLQTIHLPPELQQQFQRVQFEMRKIQAATDMTQEQKQTKLLQLQGFQKRILLKGRVLATTKTEPSQLRHGLISLSQNSITSSSSLPSATAQLLASSSETGPTPSSQNFLQRTLASMSRNTTQQTTGHLAGMSQITTQQSTGHLAAMSQITTQQSTGHLPGMSQITTQQSTGHLPGMSQITTQQSTGQLQTPDSSIGSSDDHLGSSVAQSYKTAPSTSSSTLASLFASSPSTPVTNTSSVNQLQATPTAYISSNQQSVSTPSQDVVMTTQIVSQPKQQTSTESTVPQVAVPTQIKIADKVLTLSLTPAQREKVQSYLDRMTPEQQQQYLQTQQHVLQRIQKQQALNAQIRAQVEAQKKLAAANNQPSTSGQTFTTPKMEMEPASIPDVNTRSTPQVKTIPIPNTQISVPQVKSETPIPNRGIKRPYMDIPKGTLINQQIRQDQNHAVAPDTKRPFRSKGDACRRLLRFHVFQMYGPSQTEFTKFDSYMEDISGDLLRKKDRMTDKFRQLLVQETFREQPSSELVMLQRMQNQDLRKLLEDEKQQVKHDPESFTPMPAKYLYRNEKSTSVTSEASHTTPEEEVDDDDDKSSQSVNLDLNEEATSVDSSETFDNGEIGSSEGSDVKVRKLVIKSDGNNFSSSFKRKSLDQRHSTLELCETIEDSDDDAGTGVPRFGVEEEKGGFSDPSAVDEDDDTNEYSSDRFAHMDDEAERAALVISSADESEDTRMDDGYSNDNSNISQMSNTESSNNFETRHFKLASSSSKSLFYSKGETFRKSDFSDKYDYSQQSSHDYIQDQSPLSNIDTAENNGADRLMGNQGLDDSDTMDKFDMYQPITECLTDSEENSFYSADTTGKSSAANNSVLDPARRRKQTHTSRHDDSDHESDQDVKAQMESAINSILSLSHGASENTASVYSYTSQSNQFLQQDSHSNSLYSDSNDLEMELGLLSDNLHTDNSPSASVSTSAMVTEASGDFPHDLDAAVNSILM